MINASRRGRPAPRAVGARDVGERARERFPLQELEDEEPGAVRLFDAVDGADIGVIQRGEHPRLALEAGEPPGWLVNSGGRILMATSRASFVSRARYTSPMPPAPNSASRW